MMEAHEPRSVLEAAEQAAAAGDYASAEHLLREAARLQEASLGPLNPDLANTLNNLGVVCDIADKPEDAELCYRRACAIAAAVLEPDHPFVATSQKNLRDFCEARGKTVESPGPPPALSAGWGPGATREGHSQRERLPPAKDRLFAFRRSSRPLVIGVAAACVLVLAMFIAARPWFRSNGRAGSSTPGGPVQPLSGSASPTLAAGAKADPLAAAAAAAAPSRQVQKPASEPTTGAATATVRSSSPLVADALLCSDLSTGGSGGSPSQWQCRPASRPVRQGSLFFYTRLKSEHDTTVQHRWYRGDRLRQVVELRIRANPTSGYRTYSRNTVDDLSAGDWRVELRTQGGILLHEERFVVR